MAFLRISTLGSLWLGLVEVHLFRVSKASLTLLRRLLSRMVAAFLRSALVVFLLQALQAQSKHLPAW